MGKKQDSILYVGVFTGWYYGSAQIVFLVESLKFWFNNKAHLDRSVSMAFGSSDSVCGNIWKFQELFIWSIHAIERF